MQVETKLDILKKSFKENNLIIITDFNRTLTTPGHSTSFSSISKGNYLDEDYIKRRDVDFKNYFPYETGEKGENIEERKKKVNIWFRRHMKLLIEKKLTIDILKEIVNKTDNINEVRKGFKDFFEIINKNSISTYIISGGLGDMIDLTLDKYKVDKSNTKIISNNFVWFDRNLAVGFNEFETIDPINKDKNYRQIKTNENTSIIVIGDTPDDLEVLKKLKYKNSFKIGFNVKEKGTISNEKFDITLDKEDDLSYINNLLNKITS